MPLLANILCKDWFSRNIVFNMCFDCTTLLPSISLTQHSTLLFFLFMFLWLDNFKWPIFKFTDSFSCLSKSVSEALYWIFQFSYCILQLYEFCLVPYYVLFLFVEVLSVFFILLLSLVSILMTITLNSLSDVLLLSTSLGFFFSFLKFYLVPSFRTFSSISSFCLTLFLLVCKTAISSVLKDSLCLDMALLSFWGKQEFSYFSSSSQSKLFYM